MLPFTSLHYCFYKKCLKMNYLKTEVSGPNIFRVLISIKIQWWAKTPVLSMKYWHSWLLLKTLFEGIFSNKQLCQYFLKVFSVITKCTGGLNIIIFWFLMENSIVKIFGSVDVKITPDFSKHYRRLLVLWKGTCAPKAQKPVTFS